MSEPLKAAGGFPVLAVLQDLARVLAREAEKTTDPEKALDALQFAIGLNLVAEKMTRRAIAKEGK